MSRRKTVKLNLPVVTARIKTVFRHNVVFCEKMGRYNHPTWVSDWLRTPSKNLPSPEEAARMCLLLNTTPDEILTEPADIALVAGLIEQEQGIKKSPAPEGAEVSESKRKLLAAVDEMTDEQCDKMLELVLAAKKMF